MQTGNIFMILQLVCLGGLLFTTTKFGQQRSTYVYANNGSSSTSNYPFIPRPQLACVPVADVSQDIIEAGPPEACNGGNGYMMMQYNSLLGGTTGDSPTDAFFLTNDFNVILAADSKGNRCTDGLLMACDVVMKAEGKCDDLWKGPINTRKGNTKTANTQRCKNVRATNWINWSIVVFCLFAYGILALMGTDKISSKIGTDAQVSSLYKITLALVYLSCLLLFCLTLYSYSATRDKKYLDEIVGADAFKDGKDSIKSQLDGPSTIFAFQLIFSLIPFLTFLFFFILDDGWKSQAFNPSMTKYMLADAM